MLPLLAFSTVDWHDLWHRPQALMSRFAAEGWPVLYVDSVGLRSPGLRDSSRIVRRLRRAFIRRPGALPEPLPGLRVLSPVLLPFLNSPLARTLNAHRLASRLRQGLKTMGAGDPVVWIYLPTQTVLECVRALPRRLLVYESIDALGSNPAGVSQGFEAAEREILAMADLVITSSETLWREKREWNPNTHWIPSGVDDDFFVPGAVPAEVACLPKPRVGFFGTLDHRLDIDAMRRLAEACRAWSFVLIGPSRLDLSALTKLPNVHWLGPKEHRSLPGYLAGLQAVYLPYVMNEFTRPIYPAKINECLASGLPVVATALPSLEPMQGLIRLVREGGSFAEELQTALEEDGDGLRRRRVDAARVNSWNVRFRQLRELLDTALERGEA